MATLTFTSTAAQDAAVQEMTDRFNATSNTTAITAVQFVRRYLGAWLDALVSQVSQDHAVTKAAAYKNMAAAADGGNTTAAADKTTVDSTLSKYTA
jgi:hypothetical protein